MLFAFDLEHLPPGHCYTSVRFVVSLADQRFAAVGLECGTALPANSAVQVARSRAFWLQRLWRTAAARATVSGMCSSRFGWFYEAAGTALPLHSYTMHALLESPPDAAEVAGILSVEAEILRNPCDRPVAPAAVGKAAVVFTEPLVNEREWRPPVRLFAIVDAYDQQHGSRGTARQAQQRMAMILERALDQTRVNESHIDTRQDGRRRLVMLPAEADHPTLIPDLVQGLRTALREVNADPGTTRIRLLVGLDQGVVEPGPAGPEPAGRRIVESRAAKKALGDHPHADFVLVMPDRLYLGVAAQARVALGLDSFRRLSESTQGGAHEPMWLYVPEHQ
jgi:hypothetical protein